MNPASKTLIALAFLAVLGATSLRADDSVVVAVVSDQTDAGQGVAPAAPDKPQYYYPKTVGYTVSGNPQPGETAPMQALVERWLVKALASRGYVYYRVANKPPTILLLLAWGYMAPNINDDTKEFANEADMNTLVMGTQKLEDNRFSATSDALFAAARVPRYFLTITALGLDTQGKKKPVPLWTTRASTELQPNRLAQLLPTLISAATPLLGTQSERPRLVDVPLVQPR